MKKLILLLALCLLTTVGGQAQEAFKEIYNLSNKTLIDNKEDKEVRKVALFKVDALVYMNTKFLEVLLDSTKQHSYNVMARRDSMAYYMYDYVNLFTKEYARVNKKAEKDRILKIFRDASINSPLFNDPHREYVLSYYNREDFLTQFSLDTDWVKANAIVRRKLGQK
jgi:hypothetical protein